MIFCLHNDNTGCVLMQFLTGRKHGQLYTGSLGTRIFRFNHETKLTKTVQKLSKKFHRLREGGDTIASLPKYASVSDSS